MTSPLDGPIQAAKQAVRELESMVLDNYLDQDMEIKVAVEAAFKYLVDSGYLMSVEAREIIEAARNMVADRNEVYGNPSKPLWWQGFDWPVVTAVMNYEKAGKRDSP